jgi:hypothetical protein
MPSRLTLKLPTLEAGLEEAARSLAEMVRDSVPRHHTPAAHRPAIEVRDDTGPVLNVKCSFEIDRRKQ